MTLWRIMAFLAGAVCLVWLFHTINIHALVSAFAGLSPARTVVFAFIFPIAIGCDALAWNMVLAGAAVCRLWFARLWQLLIVADAMQVLTPFGSFAGEPIKAMLLNRRYHLQMSDAAASLLAMQVLLALSQVPFVLVGLAITLHKHILPASYDVFFSLFILVIMVFLVVLIVAIRRRWLAKLLPRRFQHYLGVAMRIEDQLVSLLHSDGWRFCISFAATACNWFLFAIELWAMAWVLGAPISLSDAWAMEALITLVRSATFFVPGHLGAQEGAYTYAFAAFTHNPALGLACALLRRVRELLWALVGAAIGAMLGWQTTN